MSGGAASRFNLRLIVSRCGLAVLTAEHHPVIVIVRPELTALLVQQFGVCPEHGEGERGERQDVLRVRGLAVRLDNRSEYVAGISRAHLSAIDHIAWTRPRTASPLELPRGQTPALPRDQSLATSNSYRRFDDRGGDGRTDLNSDTKGPLARFA